MKKPPKKIWGAVLNLTGAWNKPICFYRKLNEYTDKYEYWDRSGNISIRKPGLDKKDRDCITYSSENKRDVEDFIEGNREVLEEAIIGGQAILDVLKSPVATLETVVHPKKDDPKILGTEQMIKWLERKL